MLVSVFVALMLAGLGVGLLLHHGYSHSFDPPDSNARREGYAVLCYFQVPDISNHETWIIVCLTNALSLGVLGPLINGVVVA